jgi:hypothetical protein
LSALSPAENTAATTNIRKIRPMAKGMIDTRSNPPVPVGEFGESIEHPRNVLARSTKKAGAFHRAGPDASWGCRLVGGSLFDLEGAGQTSFGGSAPNSLR